MSKIRTRFAPSPTGYLHIGSLRTALFNYIYAKQNNGTFILRIEDTDQTRYVKGATEKMAFSLKTLGISPDEGVVFEKNKLMEIGHYHPYVQSRRLDYYKKIAHELVNKKLAYYCFCSTDRLKELRENQQQNKQVPKYDEHCRHLSGDQVHKSLNDKKEHTIRFKIPRDKIITAEDKVYGKISVKTQDLDDFVIMKSDGYPTYHLANVIDDHAMQISHVIRGEEWMPSLPKHILLYQALGYSLPTFVHLPLLLNPDKSKLSKRQGDVAVEDFIAKGYLPPAMLNYVALLGWNPGNDKEFFSINQLIKDFSLEKINKAGAVFDIQKLNWFNAEYIRKIIEQGGKSYENLIKYAEKFLTKHPEKANQILKIFGSRINYLAELDDMTDFLWHLPNYEPQTLIFKKSDKTKTAKGLNLALGTLSKIKDSEWNLSFIDNSIKDVATLHNLSPGDIFWPLRVAVSGLDKSPSPAEIISIIGREATLGRIKKAINIL